MTLMKLKSIPMLLAAAALGLTGCNKQPSPNGGGSDPAENAGKVVYLSAGIALPSTAGTRSATDAPDASNPNNNTNSNGDGTGTTPDFEYGYDYENDVRTVLLVISDAKTDKYVAHTIVSDIMESPATSQPFDFIVDAEIKYEDLKRAYKNEIFSDDYSAHVWVFCNYTGALLKQFEALKEEAEKGESTTDLASWVDWKGEISEDASPAGHTPTITNTIWAKRSFLMTNAHEALTVQFPDDITGWEPYSDKDHPFYMNTSSGTTNALTPIHVERVAARIDFKGNGANNLYHLFTLVQRKNDTPPQEEIKYNLFDIQLNRMALVNMSKDFYYLRRVSADGTDTDAAIGGLERRDNYVVDTDWASRTSVLTAENAINWAKTTAPGKFNFTLFNKDNGTEYNKDGWYVDKIEDVLKGEKDNWQTQDYKIWRYVTENTIPKVADENDEPDAYANQQTVWSTGIVFKGAIKLGADITGNNYTSPKYPAPEGSATEPIVSQKVIEALKKAEESGKEGKEVTEIDFPHLYSFQNVLYAGAEDLVKAALDAGENSPLYLAVENALAHWTADNEEKEFVYGANKANSLSVEICNDVLKKARTDITFDLGETDAVTATGNLMTEVAKEGITVYRASDEDDGDGWGYYCYYFYWNRHNDNARSNRMGRMEFAIVRNNVYKLAVTKISQLGHPRIAGYDPDPVTPDDPDEEPLEYIQVKVEVLPWVVRVNDIEF